MRSVSRPRRSPAAIVALSTVAAVVLTTGISDATPTTVPVPDEAGVYELANGCYGVQAASGEFVRRSGSGYRADGATAGDAEPFRLHAAALGRFMFFGTDTTMLAHDGAGAVTATAAATAVTDWTVMSTGTALVLTATSNGRQLVTRGAELVMSEPGVVPDSGAFTLVERSGCADFPESEVNATGPVSGLGPNGEVRGFIDTHVHVNASEFLGGNIHCGRPFDPQGIAAALVDCPDHQPNGLPAVLENVVSYGNPFKEHDTTGWPSFADWPAQDSLTHEQTYFKWVERAWRGGLRIFTNLLVANRVLCEVYPSTRNPCDEMATIRIQAEQTRQLQDYIDAQYGGPGKGWFRIARSPEEVRRIAADGKLAVTLGVEISEPFGCSLRSGVPQCTKEDIDRGLDELQALGVRQMIVTHKFDNALGGVRFDIGITGVAVNVGNYLATGDFWRAEPCAGVAEDHPLPTTVEGADALIGLLPPGATIAVYPPDWKCNSRGLTDLGEYTVRGLMARGMIVDIDHMGVKTAEATLDILEAAGYSGVVSSHSWSDTAMYKRIYALGGFVALYAGKLDGAGGDEKGHDGFVDQWREARAMRSDDFYFGFGYGADTNGFGAQAPPRQSAETHPLLYPYTTFEGTIMDRQRTGTRVFDVNTDGVAQYGLIPDWIADMRNVAGADGDTIIEDMSRGAEAYLQMWERARS
ncbi:microsomal dipeptidase-like Zn-dependent dipeptidase [Rhodococcus sp. 27YEA15]|uniref:peptidase n=1 Tax=Rhodococcus sp. 27YEA15 TaxID=3156259 RepID=UPI003C7B148D